MKIVIYMDDVNVNFRGLIKILFLKLSKVDDFSFEWSDWIIIDYKLENFFDDIKLNFRIMEVSDVKVILKENNILEYVNSKFGNEVGFFLEELLFVLF